MPRKLTDKVKEKRMLKKILTPKIDLSVKFTPPTIMLYKTDAELNSNEPIPSSHIEEKLKVYRCRNPFRILPLIQSGLKLYKLKHHDKFFLDRNNNSKDVEELISIPKGLNIVCLNKNQIRLVGAGAIGSWMTIPESDEVFHTMYSRTGHKTMAEYMVKNKIKTNYKHKKKIYNEKRIKQTKNLKEL